MKTKNREKTRFGVLPGTISIQIREPGSAITRLPSKYYEISDVSNF